MAAKKPPTWQNSIQNAIDDYIQKKAAQLLAGLIEKNPDILKSIESYILHSLVDGLEQHELIDPLQLSAKPTVEKAGIPDINIETPVLEDFQASPAAAPAPASEEKKNSVIDDILKDYK